MDKESCFVSCVNKDKGAKKACAIACIGCSKCFRYAHEAITMADNLAYTTMINANYAAVKNVHILHPRTKLPPRKKKVEEEAIVEA